MVIFLSRRLFGLREIWHPSMGMCALSIGGRWVVPLFGVRMQPKWREQNSALFFGAGWPTLPIFCHQRADDKCVPSKKRWRTASVYSLEALNMTCEGWRGPGIVSYGRQNRPSFLPPSPSLLVTSTGERCRARRFWRSFLALPSLPSPPPLALPF